MAISGVQVVGGGDRDHLNGGIPHNVFPVRRPAFKAILCGFRAGALWVHVTQHPEFWLRYVAKNCLYGVERHRMGFPHKPGSNDTDANAFHKR
jgi:hypothetical protein